MRIFEKKFFHHPFFGWIFEKICIYPGAKTMRIFGKICFFSPKFMKFVLVQDTSFFPKIRISIREKRYWVAYALT